MNEKNFDIGFLLIFFLWDIIFVSTIFYILGISMKQITLLFVVISCLAVFPILKYFFKMRKNIKIQEIILDNVVILILVLISLAFCGSVFDFSWDGNNYQKAIIGLLEYGWNPIYSTYDDVANISKLFSIDQWSTWFDAYPKASSIIAAFFYTLTGNIETGKAYTILSCIAGICITSAYLTEMNNESKPGFNYLISIALFINPVSVSQCVTFYNDAFLWNMLFITFFSCMYLSMDENLKYKIQSWALIFFCIGVGFNIKFSALIYFALICGGFYFYWIRRMFITKKEDKWDKIKGITIFFVITVVFSTCILGSTSYVKNSILHHNPVYTMIGADKSEIIDSEAPAVLKSLSRGERVFVSLLSESSNDKNIEELQLKIPFTISEQEKNVYWVDARIGGWGIFYSGMLLISLISITFLYKEIEAVNRHCLIMLLVYSFIPAVIIPGLFWARYWMILFIIPCLIMYWLSAQPKMRWVAVFLLVLSLGNIVFPTLQVVENVAISQNTKIEYLTLARIAERNKLAIKLGADEFIFNGLVFNLNDYGIKNYHLDNQLVTENCISAGQGRIFYEILESDNET